MTPTDYKAAMTDLDEYVRMIDEHLGDAANALRGLREHLRRVEEPATSPQDAHTPRERTQTPSRGTESGQDVNWAQKGARDTTPDQAYSRKHLQRRIAELEAQTARDRADLDATHTMQRKREADVTNLGQANAALVAQVDRVRALARDIEYQERVARRESSEAVETVYRIIGRRLRDTLDTNPKPAPSGAKAGSNKTCEHGTGKEEHA